MSDFEDDMLEDMFDHLRDFVPTPGCPVCKHEIINCRNHTHCSSLGFELICDCEVCHGTGRMKETMEKALAIQKEVQRILGTEEVYLVGGSVRDLEMGNTPKDYDFTTSMLPEEMIEKVKEAGRRVYTIGEKFGTIGFKVPVNEFNGPKFSDIMNSTEEDEVVTVATTKYEYVEVTTFRSEVYTGKSRKPEVKFVPSLDEDLARRDFTFNAMVLRSDGTIYDPYGGRLHLYKKKIQTVGMPKDRIQEDPLRMLRAARFAARYDFDIDPNFIGKARQLASRIYDVSIERWVMELDKLFTSQHAHRGVEMLHQMGLLIHILPELYYGEPGVTSYYENPFSLDQKPYESADLAWKNVLQQVHQDRKIARYIAAGICLRLKFSNDRTDLVLDKVKKKD